MKSDPSARKTVTIATLESSVSFSSETNSPVSFATMESAGEKVEEHDETMGNLDIGEVMDHLNLDQKDFTTRNSGVSSNVHQVCVIITEAAEENDDAGNMEVDTQGNKPRSNNGKEKEKIYVSTREWRVIMSVINHGMEVPANSRREVLMGYQYAMHQHKKKLQVEKSELKKSQESNIASSISYWNEYSETSNPSKEIHREQKHSRRKTARIREGKCVRSISAPLSDEEENFIQETPEAALVAAQVYLLTTQPEPGDPQEHMHQAAIKSLGLVGDKLKQHSSEKKSTYYKDKGKKSQKYQSSQPNK
jgi:hypothetical protein